MHDIPRTVPHDVAAALLLLSREKLTEEDIAYATSLLDGMEEGPRLLQLAYEKFSLPFVAKHLTVIRPYWYKPEMVQHALQQMAFQTLRVAGAQVNFQTRCIAPQKARHAYIKGLALASQYYDDLGLRFSRDVDLMVDRKQIRNVIALARQEGYDLIDNGLSQTVLTAPRDIDAALRYERVVNLRSPEGVLIEVHKEIDKDQGIFNETKMIWQASPVSIQSVAMNTLPHALNFVYVAYHCARHSWSSLHWMADLDAIYHHKTFDPIAVRALSDSLGLRPLVEASITFVDRSKRLPEQLSADDRVDAMLNLCTLNLEGGLDIEGKIRANHTRYALPFEWMIAPALKRKMRAYRFKGRFRPRYKDYAALPLPPAMNWLYLLTRPVSKYLQRFEK